MRFAVDFLLCVPLLAQPNDWLIVPGRRLGPITVETNRQALGRFFGKHNIVDRDVDSGEGPEPATVIFPKDSTAGLAVFWQGDRIDYVSVCFERQTGPCKWHTKERITLGTPFAKLESLNGRPFSTVEWEIDSGGNITSWGGWHTGAGIRGQWRLPLAVEPLLSVVSAERANSSAEA